MPEQQQLFRDFDISFDVHPITKNLLMKNGVDAIKQSFKNLIFTNFYEKPFHPEIGSNIKATLFENISTKFLGLNIERFIREVALLEPRIDLQKVEVIAAPDDNYIVINIEFFAKGIANPVSFDITLERVR